MMMMMMMMLIIYTRTHTQKTLTVSNERTIDQTYNNKKHHGVNGRWSSKNVRRPGARSRRRRPGERRRRRGPAQASNDY